MCPECQSEENVIKKGKYIRRSDRRKIQRFYCKLCRRGFSSQTLRIDYRFRKRSIDQTVFRLLCKGMSQRACAFTLGVKPRTIARRVIRFGKICEENLASKRQLHSNVSDIMFDELETFEHSKLKPLTVPIAVESNSRMVLSVGVAPIAAKGKLAKKSIKKYGYRKCERSKALNNMLKEISSCLQNDSKIRTDKSPHYPSKIRDHFPSATHISYKGKRGCVVGQGELKAASFDPLFSLNHTYAMFRDNLKTLTRRTWCTVKRVENFLMLLNLYAWFHNLKLENTKKVVLRRFSRTF